jgi:hypothetical protein
MVEPLTRKDVIGPIVSGVAALLSVGCFLLTYLWSRRMANRSIYVDGQKFIIEICNHLMAEPLLWHFYDDYPLREENTAALNTHSFQGKLRAFAHLHLNMFEIVVNEVPPPARGKKKNASNVWYDCLRDTRGGGIPCVYLFNC